MPKPRSSRLFPDMSEPDSAFGNSATAGPLADRMRPRELSEFVGQEQLVGEGRVLRRLIESGGKASASLTEIGRASCRERVFRAV